MKIASSPSNLPVRLAQNGPIQKPPSAPVDQVTTSSEKTTPPLVKAGKIALVLGAATAVGALGYYAGTGSGTAQLVAGAAAGGLTGLTALGTVGLFGDVMGGIMGNSNKALPMAIAGGVGGAALGALAHGSPWAGGIMALTGGLSAAVIASASTNVLHK